MKKTLLLLTSSLFLAACSTPTVTARTYYTSRTDLASYVLDTPDPLKETKGLGQLIWVRWSTPSLENTPVLSVRIRFAKGSQKDETYPIDRKYGWLMVEIPHQEREERGEIQSYSIQMKSNEQTLAQTQHTMWVEKIEIQDS